MIRYLPSSMIYAYPRLTDSMFQDRRRQFVDRLGWSLRVCKGGLERDEYDCGDAIYIIWENTDGSHGASMRLMPTIGRTMVNDHFRQLNNGAPIVSSKIWECTRLCATPQGCQIEAPKLGALMMAAHEFGVQVGLKEGVGVFDSRIGLIYRRLGWEPNIVGRNAQRDIFLGLWSMNQCVGERIAMKAGLPLGSAKSWFDAAYPLLRREIRALDLI